MAMRTFRWVSAASLLLVSGVAGAHYPWLLVGNPYPHKEGQEAKVYVGMGHVYPLDSFMEKERLENLKLITPAGVTSDLLAKNEVEYRTEPLNQAGVHMVIANQGKGYFTKTRQGGERKPKTGLSDVVRCFYSDNTMKAVFGEGDGAVLTRPVGHSLEIVPLANPAVLKVGDELPVQVLYRGQPYEGMVFATYEGFSTNGAYAYSIGTDAQGKAAIRLLDRGRWLIYSRVEQSYPDPAVCDVEAFNSTLTFSLR